MDKHCGVGPGVLRVDDPWQDTAAGGLWTAGGAARGGQVPQGEGAEPEPAAVYGEVQRSAAFREVRARYRRFVFPAVAGFVGWYLLYVVAATTAPRLMAHRLAGELNVAMVAGLAQFATTFLLTWAYARHARVRRDPAALELRWRLATGSERERAR